MDVTLVTVTVLSMGMAAALSVIVWRLLREERHRSEARIADLTAAARESVTPASAPLRRQPPAPPEAADLPLRAPDTAPVLTGAMFVETRQPTPWVNRLAVMAALVLIVASGVLFSMAARKAGGDATPAQPAAVARAAEAPAPGLELLSLRDARENGSLTITGMVQNPRTGSLLSRVAVTAYAFDEKGAFLASGRALLDVTSLAPGDDSPFVVTVPVTETVARYRIGFRADDGRVISHVDKRPQSPVAALW